MTQTSNLASIHRVASRFSERTADAIGDPKSLLSEFEAMVKKATFDQGALNTFRELLLKGIEDLKEWQATPTPPGERRRYTTDPDVRAAQLAAEKLYFVTISTAVKLQDVGHRLFLGILQSSTLPPALRKKVEMASRTYLKKPSRPRSKGHGAMIDLEYLDIYEKFIKTIHGHLEVAKQAVAKGIAHSDEGPAATRLKVGDFTLVNTGGFSEKVMSECTELVKKATALIKSSDLGKVCYGDILITNTVGKSNSTAFYLIASDELFVRANTKTSWDTLHTICHELGHRYEHKFLSGKKRDIEALYQQLGHQEYERTKVDLKKKQPKPGEEITNKGVTFIVTYVIPAKGGYRVNLAVKDNPARTAHVDLETYLRMKGQVARDVDENPNYKGFVSDYAESGGPGENFAEMFAFYAMGRLPVFQSLPFEQLVFGTGKSAHDRSTHRIASRAILVENPFDRNDF